MLIYDALPPFSLPPHSLILYSSPSSQPPPPPALFSLHFFTPWNGYKNFLFDETKNTFLLFFIFSVQYTLYTVYNIYIYTIKDKRDTLLRYSNLLGPLIDLVSTN